MCHSSPWAQPVKEERSVLQNVIVGICSLVWPVTPVAKLVPSQLFGPSMTQSAFKDASVSLRKSKVSTALLFMYRTLYPFVLGLLSGTSPLMVISSLSNPDGYGVTWYFKRFPSNGKVVSFARLELPATSMVVAIRPPL